MIPVAFRIRDFRSIKDSGVCSLSGDHITVLAGQNESGKTAVLQALKDFDVPNGSAPASIDYVPEGRFDAEPVVSVKFEIDPSDIRSFLDDHNFAIPEEVHRYLEPRRDLWIHRHLQSAIFRFDGELEGLWPEELRTPSLNESEEEEFEEEEEEEHELAETRMLRPSEFADMLRLYWPLFVYFDSFENILPREVDLSALKEGTAPQAVMDFLSLSGFDSTRLVALGNDQKAIGNYLRNCGALVSGDFLTYWKQRTYGESKVELRVQYIRDPKGNPKLAFFVHDQVDQYPQQRSRGFLWFLSFYLRLAAEAKKELVAGQLLLIDEPGTYLHARAQRDVLHLFEDRLSSGHDIIYSTHSPFLLPPDKLHRVRIVIKTAKDGTLVLDKLTHQLLRGDDFSDTLSPIISAIGLDIQEALTFAKPKNLLVEGISDRLYLEAWASYVGSDLFASVNVFPGTGARSLVTFASLFIGWGLEFGVLLDRDDIGEEVKQKLLRELSISETRITQPLGALAIEDVFSYDDFRTLLEAFDPTLALKPGEKPTTAIRRLRVDKVLLSRKFSELVSATEIALTATTVEAVHRLLGAIEALH